MNITEAIYEKRVKTQLANPSKYSAGIRMAGYHNGRLLTGQTHFMASLSPDSLVFKSRVKWPSLPRDEGEVYVYPADNHIKKLPNMIGLWNREVEQATQELTRTEWLREVGGDLRRVFLLSDNRMVQVRANYADMFIESCEVWGSSPTSCMVWKWQGEPVGIAMPCWVTGDDEGATLPGFLEMGNI